MKIRYFLMFALLATLFACSEHDYESGSTLLPMEFATEYPMSSRATDTGFANGDKMGIYVYDYKNMAFSYNEAEGKWTGNSTIYWKDSTTPVDVIGYYPYSPNIEDAARYSFSIETRQDKTDGYEQSDLLWAKAGKVQPGSGKIMLSYHHIMAGITIALEKGDGFTDTEWAEAEKHAYISNAVTTANVNLETGEVSPQQSGAAQIIPTEYNGTYRAVLVPQIYKQGEQILGVDVNGHSYSLKKDEVTAFVSGKMHKYTLKVDKRTDTGGYSFSLVGESISQWIDDEDFHDGIVRDYLIVNVPKAGQFANTLNSLGYDYLTIESLKVTGYLNSDDIMFMGDMPLLSDLNMKEADLGTDAKIPDYAFMESQLVHVVLPDKLKAIGHGAFRDCPLNCTIVFPEGLTTIGSQAFIYSNIIQVVFPSTLKRIEESAFASTYIRGGLTLPEGLEYIGYAAFERCDIEGNLTLPSTLKEISDLVFYANKFTGDLRISGHIKKIGREAFESSGFDGNLILEEGIEEIGDYAFEFNRFCGELALPSTVRRIGRNAFHWNCFANVNLPAGLEALGDAAFSENSRLMGNISLPPNIKVVPHNCFEGCPFVTSITLHKDIIAVGNRAFAGMQYLKEVKLEAEEPPMLSDNAFDDILISNVKLFVPRGKRFDYKNDHNWSCFKTISENYDFFCRPATLCALNSQHTEKIVIDAKAGWKVAEKPEWITLSDEAGSGKKEISVTINSMSGGVRTGDIVFRLDDSDVETVCQVAQYDYQYKEDEIVVLQKHNKGNGIGIYFVGDGWNGETISSGEYLSLCKQEMEYFFGLPPYDRLRDMFDVYAVMALSQENGINTLNISNTTKFSTFYSNGYFIYDDEILSYLKSLAVEGLQESLVILIPNCADYSGCTYYLDNGATISICPPSNRSYPSDTRGNVQHEAGGHGFGKLADESVTIYGYATDNDKMKVLKLQAAGWYQNISTTGAASNVPWSDLIYDPRYSNYVDVFEGGYNYFRHIWRSEANSCMDYGIPYYNAISRLDITRRVFNLAGVPFNINRDFYDVDTDEWGSTGISRAAAHSTQGLAPFRNPQPVFMDNNMRKKIKELRKKQKRQ